MSLMFVAGHPPVALAFRVRAAAEMVHLESAAQVFRVWLARLGTGNAARTESARPTECGARKGSRSARHGCRTRRRRVAALTPLRLAVDVDGVVADIASAYRQVASELFPDLVNSTDCEPSEAMQQSSWSHAAEGASTGSSVRLSAEQRERIWQHIKATNNFWTTLRPLEPRGLGRLNTLVIEHKWDVIFVTQRPHTCGETVQRQTHRWLVEHGFELPTVLAVQGSRGQLAAVLRADILIDDLLENCQEAVSCSHVTAMLVWPGPHSDDTPARARRLGITVARSFCDCLDVLEKLGPGFESPERERTGRLGRGSDAVDGRRGLSLTSRIKRGLRMA